MAGTEKLPLVLKEAYIAVKVSANTDKSQLGLIILLF